MVSERKKKGQESRIRLLAAAAHEFAQQGYHKTRVSEIVARAGLTQAAFYLYFPSKETVFNELIESFRSKIFAMIETVRLAPGLSLEDMPHYQQRNLESFLRFLMHDPNLTRIGLLLAPDAE